MQTTAKNIPKTDEFIIHQVVPIFQIKKERKAYPNSLIFFLLLLSLEIKSSKNKSGISPKKTKKDRPLTGQEIVNKIPEIRDRIISFLEKNI